MKTIARMACLLAWGCLVVPVLAEDVQSVDSETKPMERTIQKRVRLPRSIAAGIGNAAAPVRLPAVNLADIQAEDDARDPVDKALRIGIFRELPVPVAAARAKSTLGGWIAMPDGGHIWRLVVESPEAIGIRVHLAELALPDGCEITAYSTLEPSQMRGPYSSGTLDGREAFWTGTVFAESVTVEGYCPPGVSLDKISLTADRLIHIYRDPVSKAKEGNCHNDVTCYPAWGSVRNGVAGIGSVGDSGYLWCTGCLLNDQAPSTFIDYFMTANHCVASQSEADDTEFYWFYQSSSCNGSPPNIASVPSTDGGAVYLAGRTYAAANDFSFLRLRTASPGGVTYAGWSVATPSSSETLTGIHHPDGAYKRISFGNREASDANYWFVHWSSGVTEPGSSGSPLFNASQQFIGQLYGGYSACGDPDGIDDYGRFNVSYPYISRWLGSSALTLSPLNRTHSSSAASGQTLAVSASGSWTATDNRDWIAVTSGNSGTGNGTVTYRITANGGAVRTGSITVTGGGSTQRFTVTQLDGDRYEADNSSPAAKLIGNRQTQNRSIHQAGDWDWVKFRIGPHGARRVDLKTSGASGDTQLWLYGSDSAGASAYRRFAYNDDGGPGSFSRIWTSALASGTYFVKIQEYGNNGTIPAYTLQASWIPATPAADAYESDNNSSRAKTISNGRTQVRTIHAPRNRDWAKFRIGSRGARKLVVQTAGKSGDTQLWLYRQNRARTGAGKRLAYDDNRGVGNFSKITRSNLEPGTYYILVQERGNNGVIPFYKLKASWRTP